MGCLRPSDLVRDFATIHSVKYGLMLLSIRLTTYRTQITPKNITYFLKNSLSTWSNLATCWVKDTALNQGGFSAAMTPTDALGFITLRYLSIALASGTFHLAT